MKADELEQFLDYKQLLDDKGYEENDELYVPVIGSIKELSPNVPRNQIYEVRDRFTAANLMELAKSVESPNLSILSSKEKIFAVELIAPYGSPLFYINAKLGLNPEKLFILINSLENINLDLLANIVSSRVNSYIVTPERIYLMPNIVEITKLQTIRDVDYNFKSLTEIGFIDTENLLDLLEKDIQAVNDQIDYLENTISSLQNLLKNTESFELDELPMNLTYFELSELYNIYIEIDPSIRTIQKGFHIPRYSDLQKLTTEGLNILSSKLRTFLSSFSGGINRHYLINCIQSNIESTEESLVEKQTTLQSILSETADFRKYQVLSPQILNFFTKNSEIYLNSFTSNQRSETQDYILDEITKYYLRRLRQDSNQRVFIPVEIKDLENL